MRHFIADRRHYIIDHIEPKDGVIKSVHETILGRECQIMTLKLGQSGALLVDVGDHIFGLHRIVLSHVLTVEGEDDICIHTENTVYYLKSKASENADPAPQAKETSRCSSLVMTDKHCDLQK